MLATLKRTNRNASFPLADQFRSVVMFVKPGEDADFTVPTDLLCEWLASYDAWFKEASRVEEGRNIHLLYRRTVSLSGGGILGRPQALSRIGKACAPLGMGFTLALSISECLHHPAAFQDILPLAATGVTLVLDQAAVDMPVEACLALVEQAVGKTSVTLVGPIDIFDSWGVLDSQQCNCRGLNLAPRATLQSVDLSGVRESWYSPCYLRMAVYVDTDGNLYPCSGLVGERAFSLGTIFEPVEDTLLAGKRKGPLDLGVLAQNGPFSEGVPEHVVSLGQATVCNAHRRALGISPGS